jgi:hypothetical protein
VLEVLRRAVFDGVAADAPLFDNPAFEDPVGEEESEEDAEGAGPADCAMAGGKKPKSMRNSVPVRIETTKQRTQPYLQVKIPTHH